MIYFLVVQKLDGIKPTVNKGEGYSEKRVS
jgi:hypothetical protein